MKQLLILAGLLCAAPLFAQVPVISASSASVQEGQNITLTCTTNCTSLVWKVNGITGGNSTVGTISGSGSTATYTAPASIVANNNFGGCQVFPNDSVWNTPANTLPYISNYHGHAILNDAYFINWLTTRGFQNLSFDSGIGTTIANNTTPLIPIQSHYGVYKDNVPIPIWPALKRESGTYSETGAGGDHHTGIVETDTCKFHEVYNDSPQKTQCTGDPAGTTNCYLASSTTKNASSYGYTWAGGTDAAGEPLIPMLPHLDEIKAGAVKHALRFDLVSGYAPNSENGVTNFVWPADQSNGGCSPGPVQINVINGGTGYAAGTTLSISGGHGSGATATLTISSGVIQSVTVTNTGVGYFTTDTVTLTLNNTGGGTGATFSQVIDWPCPPYGARYVLDQAYFDAHNGAGCTAGSKCLTGAAITVAQALVTYGMFMNDNTCCGIFSAYANSDLSQDQTIMNQVLSGSTGLGTLSISAFHVVDESGLAKSSVTGVDHTFQQNSQVVASNDAGLTPPNAIWITATNASGPSLPPVIAPVAPTIGTTDPEIYILAGDYSGSKGSGGGYQIPFWVNNSPGGNAVTWSLQASPNGSITAGGIYTPPASVTATGEKDTATATLTADPNVTEVVYINILPNAAPYTANTILVDTGRSSNFVDGNGKSWISDQGYETPNRNVENDGSWKYYVGTGENTVYATQVYTGGDNRYKFIVPNGNYRVRIMSGWGGNSSISTTAWNHMPIMVSGTNVGVGVVTGLHWNMMQMAAYTFAGQSNSDIVFGEKVTDNTLQSDLAQDAPIDPSWPTCGTTGGGTCFYQPTQSGLDIEPDATQAHWQIATATLPSQNGTNFINSSQSQPVPIGGSIYLYVNDWYTGLVDPTWSIVSGPGSISPKSLQLSDNYAFPVAVYTPPATQPGANTGVIIKAQSQSNPTISTTINLTIQGQQTTPSFFK